MSWVLDTAFSIHTVTASLLHDKYLYVGNDDNCIRVWNTMTSTLYRVLQGHTSIITGFAYASKYDLLFSVGIDGNMFTWHGSTCVYKYTHFKPPNNRFPASIYSIYFSNDLDIIVLGLDCEVVTFELSSKMIDVLVDNANKCPFKLRQSVKMHTDRVHHVIGGGRRIYTASYDRTVCSATILDTSIYKQISKHQTAVSTMIFDNMTQNLIVGDNSGIIRTFSADGLSLGPLAEGLEGSVSSLFYDQSLHLLWFVLSNGEVELMDILHTNVLLADHFQIFKKLPLAGSDTTHFERILGNSYNTRICAIVNRKYVYTWRWSELTSSFKLDMPNKPISRLFAFNYLDDDPIFPSRRKPSSRKPLLDSSGGSSGPSYARINSSLVHMGLNLFVAGSSKVIASRPVSEFVYTNDDVFVSKDISTVLEFIYAESALMIGYRTGKLTVVSLANPRIHMDQHGADVSITHIISFGSSAITFADDMSMVLWDVRDKLVASLRRERIHDGRVTCIALCEPKRLFMTCDDCGFCRIWRVCGDLQQQQNLNGGDQMPNLTSREQIQNLTSRDQIQNLTIKEELLLDHSSYGPISHSCYSASSDLWICASQDGFVRAWPVSQPLQPPSFNFNVLPCHVTAMAAGPRSDLYIATEDKTIRLMSLKNAGELGIYTGHTDLITQICVPPSGKRWVSLQWNGEVYFWVFKMHDKYNRNAKNDDDDEGDEAARHLPKLSKKIDPPRAKTSSEKEKPISFYDKARKTLLLKRREEERQLKAKKKSHTWKMLVSMTHEMEKAMEEKEREKKNGHPSITSSQAQHPPPPPISSSKKLY